MSSAPFLKRTNLGQTFWTASISKLETIQPILISSFLALIQNVYLQWCIFSQNNKIIIVCFNYDGICTSDCEELGAGLASQAVENDSGMGSKKAVKASTCSKQDKVSTSRESLHGQNERNSNDQ